MTVALPVNGMSGLVGGIVVRTNTSIASADPSFGGAGTAVSEHVNGAELTLLRLNLGTAALADRGVRGRRCRIC